jgi:hypothetical protein
VRGEDRAPARNLEALLLLTVLALLCLPYLRTILSPAGRGGTFPFTFNGIFLWTVVAAGIVPLLLVILRIKEKPPSSGGERFCMIWIAAVLALGVFARMPLGNVNKFVYLVFLPLIVLAGDGVPALCDAARRLGFLRRPAFILLSACAVATVVLGIVGYSLDSGVDVPVTVREKRIFLTEYEREGYEWIVRNTRDESVFIDGDRRAITVLGRRRQLWTEGTYAETWGYPPESILWRERIVEGIYRTEPAAVEDFERLSVLGSPVYVVFRPGDTGFELFDERISALPVRNRKVFANAAFHIYEVLP